MSNIHILKEAPQKPFKYPYRRSLIRWRMRNRVLFQLENNLEIWETQTEDLSSKGACICIDGHPIVPRQKVKLTIFLATTSIIGLTGDIVWINALKEEKRAGVFFSNMSTKMQNVILEYAFEIDKGGLLNRL